MGGLRETLNVIMKSNHNLPEHGTPRREVDTGVRRMTGGWVIVKEVRKKGGGQNARATVERTGHGSGCLSMRAAMALRSSTGMA